MTNKPKAQGTSWETELVRRAQDQGIPAERLAEGGSLDPGDVWLFTPPNPHDHDIPVVAWKRLVGGGSRRRPDGERDVVILRTDDFLYLIQHLQGADVGIVAECKARQSLNVTRTLHKTRQKLHNWKAQRT